MYSREGILSLLEELDIAYRLHEHEAVMTIAEARNIDPMPDGTLCKCLLLADTKGVLYLLAAEGGCRVDMGKLARTIGCGRLSFAPPDALEANLGCKPGSATILGLANDAACRIKAVVQGELLGAGSRLQFHPMVNTASVSFAAEDLIRFLEHVGHPPVIVDGIEKLPA